jgi:hypothetical protein
MPATASRREFLRHLGIGAAALPFVLNLPSLGLASTAQRRKRLVIVFSPNGVYPKTFWPDEEGDSFTFKESLKPLTKLKDRTLILHGVCDKVRGDGDNHMRGIGCLLTGTELFPGNIQGGSDTPAGWSKGISIDQELKNFLQANPATRTRFGSLEFGVMVPDRADTWTRMSYAGPNKPLAPIDDPYQMFAKLYGRMKDQESLRSILDDLQDDFKKVESLVSAEDRQILDEHTTFVREMEQELTRGLSPLAESSEPKGAVPLEPSLGHAVPKLEPGIKEENDNMPRITKLQTELLVSSFAADFARVATFQFTNSVGDAKMRWLGIDVGHHHLSHEPDTNKEAVKKLTRINHWYCKQLAHLANRLAETPEPGGQGSLLDNTTIVWTNELGKGNSHTLDNIPFVMVGNGLDFKMGRSLKLKSVPHNRLLLSFAHAFGHHLETFGNPDFCAAGPLTGLS